MKLFFKKSYALVPICKYYNFKQHDLIRNKQKLGSTIYCESCNEKGKINTESFMCCNDCEFSLCFTCYLDIFPEFQINEISGTS